MRQKTHTPRPEEGKHSPRRQAEPKQASTTWEPSNSRHDCCRVHARHAHSRDLVRKHCSKRVNIRRVVRLIGVAKFDRQSVPPGTWPSISCVLFLPVLVGGALRAVWRLLLPHERLETRVTLARACTSLGVRAEFANVRRTCSCPMRRHSFSAIAASIRSVWRVSQPLSQTARAFTAPTSSSAASSPALPSGGCATSAMASASSATRSSTRT